MALLWRIRVADERDSVIIQQVDGHNGWNLIPRHIKGPIEAVVALGHYILFAWCMTGLRRA